MQVAALFQHLERRPKSVGGWSKAHRRRLDGVNALTQTTCPIRIANGHARCNQLLARGGGILGLRVRDSMLERYRLLGRANGSDVFVIKDTIRGARCDERARKIAFQLVAASRMPDEEFDQVKQMPDIG